MSDKSTLTRVNPSNLDGRAIVLHLKDLGLKYILGTYCRTKIKPEFGLHFHYIGIRWKTVIPIRCAICPLGVFRIPSVGGII